MTDDSSGTSIAGLEPVIDHVPGLKRQRPHVLSCGACHGHADFMPEHAASRVFRQTAGKRQTTPVFGSNAPWTEPSSEYRT